MQATASIQICSTHLHPLHQNAACPPLSCLAHEMLCSLHLDRTLLVAPVIQGMTPIS